MNRIFKKVFNASRGVMVAVAETMSGHKQARSTVVSEGCGLKKAALVVAMASAMASGAAVAETHKGHWIVSSDKEINGNLTIQNELFGEDAQITIHKDGKLTVTGDLSVGLTDFKRGPIQNNGYLEVAGQINVARLNNSGTLIVNKWTNGSGLTGSINNIAGGEITITGTNSTLGSLVSEALDKIPSLDPNIKDSISNILDNFGNVGLSATSVEHINNGKLTVGNIVDGTFQGNSIFIGGLWDGMNGSLTNNDILKGGALIVAGAGKVQNTNQADLSSVIATGGKINNSGTMTVSGDSLAIGSMLPDFEGKAQVVGVLDILPIGHLQVLGDFTNSGTYNVGTNKDALMALVGGTFDNNGTVNLGTLVMMDGTVTNNGTWNSNGTALDLGGFLSGEVAWVNDIIRDVKLVSHVQMGGTVNNNSDWNADGMASAILGGEFTNNGHFDSKVLVLGDLIGSGSFTNNAEHIADIDTLVMLGGTFTNHGTVNEQGFGSNLVEQYLPGIKNIFDIVSISHVQGLGKVDNQGTWNATNMVLFGGEFQNAGTLNGNILITAGEGQFNNQENAQANLDAVVVAGGSFENAGNVTLKGLASELLGSPSRKDNFFANILENFTVGYVQVAGRATNAGSITTEGNLVFVGGDFTNAQGKVTAHGSIVMGGNVTNQGNWTSNGMVVTSGTLNNAGSITLTGLGTDFLSTNTFLDTILDKLSVGYVQVGGVALNSGSVRAVGNLVFAGGQYTNQQKGSVSSTGSIVMGGDVLNEGTWESDALVSTAGTFTNSWTMTTGLLVAANEGNVVNHGQWMV